MNDNAEQTHATICEEDTQKIAQVVASAAIEEECSCEEKKKQRWYNRLRRLFFSRYDRVNADDVFDITLEETTKAVFSSGRILLYAASIAFLLFWVSELFIIVTAFSVKGLFFVILGFLFWLVTFLFGRLFYFMWKGLSRSTEKETATKAANVLSLLLAVFSSFWALLSIS